MTISVTALAQAAVAGKIVPLYQSDNYYYNWGIRIGLPKLSFVDPNTAQQMADLLGGQVLPLPAREVWPMNNPNGSIPPNVPDELFISFANMPNAPTAGALLVVNGGDLAQACTQNFSFGLPQEEATEQTIAYLIPGSTMSPQATAALPESPISTWPPQPQYWYYPS
jgi:hypothetical protein